MFEFTWHRSSKTVRSLLYRGLRTSATMLSHCRRPSARLNSSRPIVGTSISSELTGAATKDNHAPKAPLLFRFFISVSVPSLSWQMMSFSFKKQKTGRFVRFAHQSPPRQRRQDRPRTPPQRACRNTSCFQHCLLFVLSLSWQVLGFQWLLDNGMQ